MARILVIEDNAANLELARYLLQHRGHQVLLATDGRAGVELARRERPELIVCDLQMPVLDGYAVLEELKLDAGTARVPVVAVTAFSMSGDEQKVRNAGFDGYLSKPIEPERFVMQLEAHLPDRPEQGG